MHLTPGRNGVRFSRPPLIYVGSIIEWSCQGKCLMVKPLPKVPPVSKGQFDALLSRLIKQMPEKTQSIKGSPVPKPHEPIIPKPRPPEPR